MANFYGNYRKSKYGNTKVEFEGMTFDSIREFEQWRDAGIKLL